MIITDGGFWKGMGEVEGAGAGKSEIFFSNDTAHRVPKNDLGVDRGGEVELIFFEITNNPLEVDGFARTIETTIGEEFDDTFVGGGRVPVVIDGKTPHWDSRERVVEGKDKEIAFVTNAQETVFSIPGQRGRAVSVRDSLFKGCSVFTKEGKFDAGEGLAGFAGISVKKGIVIAQLPSKTNVG